MRSKAGGTFFHRFCWSSCLEFPSGLPSVTECELWVNGWNKSFPCRLLLARVFYHSNRNPNHDTQPQYLLRRRCVRLRIPGYSVNEEIKEGTCVRVWKLSSALNEQACHSGMAPGFVKSQKHLPCSHYSQSLVFLLGSESSLIRRCKSLFPIVWCYFWGSTNKCSLTPGNQLQMKMWIPLKSCSDEPRSVTGSSYRNMGEKVRTGLKTAISPKSHPSVGDSSLQLEALSTVPSHR